MSFTSGRKCFHFDTACPLDCVDPIFISPMGLRAWHGQHFEGKHHVIKPHMKHKNSEVEIENN